MDSIFSIHLFFNGNTLDERKNSTWNASRFFLPKIDMVLRVGLTSLHYSRRLPSHHFEFALHTAETLSKPQFSLSSQILSHNSLSINLHSL
jgi:hypothetical protein